jgi:zinc transport system substrate-binding protein
VLLVAALVGVLALAGCANAGSSDSGSATQAPKPPTTTIATSFYPMYVFTLNITKDIPDVRVVDMTKATTGCLHDYTATPEDMRNLEGARFLVVNGAGMESFMDKVSQQFPQLTTIDSSKGIPLIKGRGDEGDNPHIWVSISGAIQQVRNIGNQLAAADPTHAAQYKANTDVYIEKLEVQSVKMHAALEDIRNRDIVTVSYTHLRAQRQRRCCYDCQGEGLGGQSARRRAPVLRQSRRDDRA